MHNQFSKKIKKRTQYLRNIKMQQEADEINVNATKRQVEELFKTIKADGSTFKATKRGNACDPEKLRNFFENHFTSDIDHESKPTELTEIPEYIRTLQKICCDSINSGPPAKTEIISTLKSLKNGKASNDLPAEFYKYSVTSDALINELEALFRQIWSTQQVPLAWVHSN